MMPRVSQFLAIVKMFIADFVFSACLAFVGSQLDVEIRGLSVPSGRTRWLGRATRSYGRNWRRAVSVDIGIAAPSNILPIGCGLSHVAGAIWETQCSLRWKTNTKNVAKRMTY